MAIKLIGKFASSDFWQQVQVLGDDGLRKLGLSNWTVRIHPQDDPQVLDEESARVEWDPEGQDMDLYFPDDDRPISTAKSVAENLVVDMVDQIASGEMAC